ncbi:YfeC-like transcriptional regulator, partial [Salmonella enterica]
ARGKRCAKEQTQLVLFLSGEGIRRFMRRLGINEGN